MNRKIKFVPLNPYGGITASSWVSNFTTPLSSLSQEPLRPLEKRALNFLVNEYLLKNEYKLSSITFSDENDDQVNIFQTASFFKTGMMNV